MPRASDYNHRVIVLDFTTTADTIGARKKQWAEAFKVWSAVEFEYRPTDQFVEVANKQTYEARVWFRVRKTNRVKQSHRLQHDGKTYEILTIMDETGLNKETKILARETTS